MYVILYNPLCSNNTGYNKYLKYCKKLEKKREKYKGYNLLELIDKEKEFLNSLNKEDIVVIIGGDGTLSRVINQIKGFEIKNQVYFLKAGSGNDFARCHKKKFIDITEELKMFPTLLINNQEIKFINGVGMGIDAAVCEKHNTNKDLNTNESYYKTAIKVFKTFKQFKMKIKVDNKEYTFDKVWFVAIQNGRYFGGGMKIAPKANRLDGKLNIVVIHKIKLWRLLIIFPTIFLGLHKIFKKCVFMAEGENISLECEKFDLLQHDGEIIKGINNIEVKG